MSNNKIYLACEESDDTIIYSWKVKNNNKPFKHTASGTEDESANFGGCTTLKNTTKESKLDELYTASEVNPGLTADKVCWEVSNVSITPNGYISPEINKDLLL